jgi:hypothetical protein
MPPLIYLTPSHTRFFRVPADHALPPGEFVVRNLDKQELHVSEEALRTFEIPQKEAHALLREEMKQALKQAKDALNPGAAAPELQAEKFLRDLFQLPAGQRPTEENIRDALRPLLILLSETLAVAASDDIAAQAQAEQRMAALRATLERYGIAIDKPIEELPAKLAVWREAHPSEKDQEQVTTMLMQLKELGEKRPVSSEQ